jgi:hypothetical protein
VEISTLQRIAWNYVSQGGWSALDCDDVVIDEDFRDRPAYREGCLTDEPDFSRYDEPDAELDTDEPDSASDRERRSDAPPPDDDPMPDDMPW